MTLREAISDEAVYRAYHRLMSLASAIARTKSLRDRVTLNVPFTDYNADPMLAMEDVAVLYERAMEARNDAA